MAEKATTREGTMNAKGGRPKGPTKGTDPKEIAATAPSGIDKINGLTRVTF